MNQPHPVEFVGPLNAGAKLPWWRQLRSWRWWVYGETEPRPAGPTPSCFYHWLVLDLSLWLLLCVYPWSVTWINRQSPDIYSLWPLSVTVIEATRNSPQLKLRLDDGRLAEVELPTYLNPFFSVDSASPELAAARGNLRGCVGQVWLDSPRYTLFNVYRVWQVDCNRPDGSVYYHQIVHGSDLAGSLVTMGLLSFVLIPLLGTIWLIRVRRGLFNRVPKEEGDGGKQVKKKPPLGKRLRSWKWWIYGDIDSKPLETPLRMGWKAYLFHVLPYLLLGVCPFITHWVNRQPPRFDELQLVHGEVIKTSSSAPQISMRLDSGQMLRLTLPNGNFTGKGGEKGQIKVLGDRNADVAGCFAKAWYSVPRLYLFQRNYVWQIECDDHSAGATYADFIRYFESHMNLFTQAVLIFLVMPLVILLYVVRYRRGYYASR